VTSYSRIPLLFDKGDDMRIENSLVDEQVLKEVGRRLTRCRLDRQFSQAQLGEQSGLSKRTIERLEAGESSQFLSLIRVMRVLKLLDGLELLIPDAGPSPLDLLKLKGKTRKRASSPRRKNTPGSPWRWGDEE
jgi:transcriptional regulator with XRE-family HTH domain